MVYSCTSNPKKEGVHNHKEINFSDDWLFQKEDSIATNWESVALPHTAKIEPLIVNNQWQGNCWYKKKFKILPEHKNSHIALYFEGAMHTAEVWVNGKKVAIHKGGYLPFYVEITNEVYFDKKNLIIVKLNNEDNKQVPPGKPMTGLDFNYYGGLYRNVSLIIKDKIHISNSIEIDKIAGGGISINTTNVSSNSATIDIKLDIINQSDIDDLLQIRSTIYSPSGKIVTSQLSKNKTVEASNIGLFNTHVIIETPILWSPENPKLYLVKVEVLKANRIIDSESVNFGIRSIKFDEKGFYLNGEAYKLRGTNRHQEYPYIGYALSDNAQYRDAWKIKQAGFNFVRLSHYPHSESFMDACDELGLMVMDAIPGWQFFGDEVFQENCYKDIRQLTRRDKNHPSVILWEASLNESAMTEEFMNKAHAIVHEELQGEGIYTCGWLDYAYDVFIPARQHAKAPNYWKKHNNNRPLFIAEYGDWEYYAQNAGFNQTTYGNLKENERTSRQLRRDGQIRLAQQALNYQESHNDNLYNFAAGDANWLMFDYNRGYAPDIESSGVMDIFRLPKFAYYFYSSQKKLDIENPVLFIANYWDNPDFRDVKIYSNCNEVELWLNDKLVEKRKPDTDQNSTNLKHPPFTFKNVSYQKGTLTVKGYINGKLVNETTRNTPDVPAKIQISIDESNKSLKANCNDAVFVYAKIVDKYGNYVPSATNKVNFKIEGDAELIGDDPIISEAGIASILLKVGKTNGEIKITASSENLITESIDINVTQIKE